jgi:hypothetical protein
MDSQNRQNRRYRLASLSVPPTRLLLLDPVVRLGELSSLLERWLVPEEE